MQTNLKIITITSQNLADYPDVVCFINKNNPAHSLKTEWLKQRLEEGLRIKLLYVEGKKKAAGFLEYASGENAWRAVTARNYLFIHCIYIYPNKNKNLGFGTLLLDECIADAKQNNYNGVAVVTSTRAFMANNTLFLKYGFQPAGNDGSGNELLIYKLKDGEVPVINDWKSQLARYKGLHIVYTSQCPWIARMVEEIRESDLESRLNLKITEIKTPDEARNAPALYASFSLIYNGKMLADRYISTSRLNNILKKEALI
jgi:L-amino acid N-acyltransferase YncA